MEDAEPAEVDLVEVEVKLISGDLLLSLKVPQTCLVRELKLKIEQREGTPYQQQQLLVSGDFTNLQDTAAVGSCGEAADGRLALVLVRNSAYFPADTFTGSKDGYVFRMGPEGLGYYLDTYEDGREPQDPWDGCWIRVIRETSQIVIERGVIYWGQISPVGGRRADAGVTAIGEKASTGFSFEVAGVGFRASLQGPRELLLEAGSDSCVLGAWARA
mmetsp:Transcript_36374/g.67712  ORF Transcript_36374/g.67712 Transcript_36374/m.67712 type:complete len:216 (+) Transcript_36374:64-711(+)